MTSAKQYKRDFEKKSSLAQKAKNAVRRAVNPTPAEMREKTAKLREANRAKEERVRALEESRQQRVKAQRLREREAAARRPVQSKSPAGRSSGSRSSLGVGVDMSFFGQINQNPFGGKSSEKSKNSKDRDPLEFFYR